MPRRRLEDMPLWEQSLKTAASQNREGWSVRGNRGRVLVELRRGGINQSVMLPKELRWEEGHWREISRWIDDLYVESKGGEIGLKLALEKLVPKSNQIGSRRSVSWTEIRDGLKDRLMTEGRKIKLQSWETNYLPYIDEALLQLAKHQPKDGASLLRLTAKRWHDKPSSRGVCVSTLKRFMEYAVRDHHVPQSWLIDEVDASSVRGNPDDEEEKRLTATLTDAEVLALIAAIEKKRPDWANVVRILASTGIRPTELEHLSVKTNEEGEPQLWCSYRKSGGRRKTKPRWLEELPFVEEDGSLVSWNLAETYPTMAYPLGRDGGRRKLNGHYVEQYLRDVPLWRELKAAYAKQGLWLRGYSFRNTWNARAHSFINNEAAICEALGNSPATNARSYRQTTPRITREAFRSAVHTIGSATEPG